MTPEGFHTAFGQAFGFPEFYGRNMDAWNDCMSSLDDPSSGLTTVHVPAGTVMTLFIQNASYLRKASREQYDDLIECSAFVNYSRMDIGLPAIIALAFHD